MGRVMLAAVLVVAATRVAAAAPTRKVAIDTDPPGASVFVGDKESGSVCTTPCTIDLPLGDTSVILEVAGYSTDFESINVPKAKRGDKKPVAAHFVLTKAIGTLVVDGSGGTKGATIKVDNEDKGKAPARIDVEAGPHQVQVVLGTKTLFDDFVTVDAGAEVAVSPNGGGAGGDDDSGDHTHHEREDPDDDGTAHAKKKPGADATPLVTLAFVTDIAFRHFTYVDASANLAPYSQKGQIAFGIDGEVWPFQRLDIAALKPISVFAHVGVYSIAQTLENPGLTLSTFWRTFELSARYRRMLLDKIIVGGDLGYALDQYEFSGISTDLPKVPDAEYSGIRLAVHARVPLGMFEPYVTLENRVMLSAKLIGSSFAKTDADGKKAAIGIAAHSGRWRARLEASFISYGWTITSADDATTTATGATDHVEDITISLGASY